MRGARARGARDFGLSGTGAGEEGGAAPQREQTSCSSTGYPGDNRTLAKCPQAVQTTVDTEIRRKRRKRSKSANEGAFFVFFVFFVVLCARSEHNLVSGIPALLRPSACRVLLDARQPVLQEQRQGAANGRAPGYGRSGW